MKPLLNGVVIGYGGMGSRHAQMLKKTPGVCVTGACDILPEKRRAIEENGLFAYPSCEAVCRDPKVDFAVIATPNHLHREMAEALLRAGKHVICEKPVALGTAEAEAMARVQQETGKLFTVHQNRRWDEDYLAVRNLLSAETLGPVYNIESRVTGSRGVPHDWRRLPQCGGGMLMDWGVHLIDQMLLLVDSPVKKLFCRLSFVTGTAVDDGFLLLLCFENGVTATLEASTWKFLNLPRWYVNGKKGTAVMEKWHRDGTAALLKEGASDADARPVVTAAGITKTMAPRENDSVEEIPFPLAPSMPQAFYENAVRAMRGEEAPIVQIPQVLRVMRLIEAARQSHGRGCPVDFE